MRVRFLVGKRAGEIENFPRNDNTVAMMLHAGIVEEVNEQGRPLNPSAPPSPHDTPIAYFPEPVWAFAYIAVTKRPAIRKTYGHSCTDTYSNIEVEDEKVVANAATKAGCPEDVVQRYLAEMKLWREKAAADERVRSQVESGNRNSPFVKVGW